ncbi:hypothetical protein JD844_010107 [Phrynosoma platyrhinos]|uniref:Follistatin-related protein 1 n=1 Tax=Phrynosoma platyrhinos TaxID=52577 RepID=A0ABQ7TGY1_PHRPL|nr:hypothetical protein JD844_010107 [Phrynosoma platyrhinos]
MHRQVGSLFSVTAHSRPAPQKTLAQILDLLTGSSYKKCKPHKRPVCGSNGKTYLNHCELHRDACLTGSKIQVDYDGHCKEKKPENSAASPVVCYQTDRDELRRRVIQWLETEIIPDGWFSKGSNYTEILDNEFLKFVEQNETAVNITTYVDQETNKLLRTDSFPKLEALPLIVDWGQSRSECSCASDHSLQLLLTSAAVLPIPAGLLQAAHWHASLPWTWAGGYTFLFFSRGLCVDALIELSDENADWKLSFNEFLKCLNPAFNPPEKKCALEDETYEDGAETQVECNRCVCACGNWVCTAMTCQGKNERVSSEGQHDGDTLTEEELARYVQELQKHQETSEKIKQMATKEM